MLADYLNKTGQSVFEFFKSIDLDDSGISMDLASTSANQE